MSLTEEILGRGIQIEKAASYFYSSVAGRLENRKSRRKMLSLSKSEGRHKRILEGRHRRLFGSTNIPISEDDSDHMSVEDLMNQVEHVLTGQSLPLHVVSFAIGLEDRAISYYTEQLEKTDEPGDIRMLKRLVRFETRHKSRLQREYIRIST